MKTYQSLLVITICVIFCSFTSEKTLISDTKQFKMLTNGIWECMSATASDTTIDLGYSLHWKTKFNNDFTFYTQTNDTNKVNGKWALNAKLNKIQFINAICKKMTVNILLINQNELQYVVENNQMGISKQVRLTFKNIK